jgi:hypothetical protein
MDVLGRSVYQQSIETLKGNDELSILIPLMEEGIFFAKISETNGNIVSQSKFVK